LVYSDGGSDDVVLPGNLLGSDTSPPHALPDAAVTLDLANMPCCGLCSAVKAAALLGKMLRKTSQEGLSSIEYVPSLAPSKEWSMRDGQS
jgi:hypothetical protein